MLCALIYLFWTVAEARWDILLLTIWKIDRKAWRTAQKNINFPPFGCVGFAIIFLFVLYSVMVALADQKDFHAWEAYNDDMMINSNNRQIEQQQQKKLTNTHKGLIRNGCMEGSIWKWLKWNDKHLEKKMRIGELKPSNETVYTFNKYGTRNAIISNKKSFNSFSIWCSYCWRCGWCFCL